MSEPFLIAKGQDDVLFDPKMGNRHGLVAGATGTGKTVSLQVLAENFSSIGVPVFLADVKGDLSGIAKSGAANSKIDARVKQLGLSDFQFEGYPVEFWDLFGENGHPVRTTISEMGPLLLGRILNLNDTQEAVLNMVFHISDQSGLLLLDLKDLRAALQYVGENASSFTTQYGNVSAASIGAIQRNLLTLEQQGSSQFFGEPALNLDDLLQTAEDGRGIINILSAEKLMLSPRLYATALLWMLSELFERLPEVGDLDKPKLVFFFDEAHLLFTDIPQALREKIEQVVRLIRSKGVGIYFVTQNPLDIPDVILGQLGNRVQHALRAFTPRDQKAVKVAAETFRQNPNLDLEGVLTELGVGEALVSLLDESGKPGVVERAFVFPPHAQVGPITAPERQTLIQASAALEKAYRISIDRESAFEVLHQRTEQRQMGALQAAKPPPQTSGSPAPAAAGPGVGSEISGVIGSVLFGATGPRGGHREGLLESMSRSAARSIGSGVGRQIVRGLLGSLFGSRR